MIGLSASLSRGRSRLQRGRRRRLIPRFLRMVPFMGIVAGSLLRFSSSGQRTIRLVFTGRGKRPKQRSDN